MGFTLYYDNELELSIDDYEPLFSMISKRTFSLLKEQRMLELSVSLVDEKTIQYYNSMYRHIDTPTDVISFALTDVDDNIIIRNQPILLGDILICYPIAVQQAKEYGHSIGREMAFLFTHGLLHLLGFDHMTESDEKSMFGMQDQILDTIRIRKEYKKYE